MDRVLVYLLLCVLLAMPVLQAAEACCMPPAQSAVEPVEAEPDHQRAEAQQPPCHQMAAADVSTQESTVSNMPHADCAHGAACMGGVLALAQGFAEFPNPDRPQLPRHCEQASTLDGVRIALIRPPSLT